jgi:Flp pilus assembly protein TadG
MNSTLKTMPSSGLRRLRGRLRRLWRSDRGSVAIEFVVIVPLMLLVLLGFTELYMYMRAVSIVEHTAFTLADSVGQMQSAINDTSTSNSNNLGSLWNAATVLAAPNVLNAKGGVIVTSICEKTTTCSASTATPKVSPLPNPLPAMTNGTAQIFWQKSAPWTPSGMASRVTAGNVVPQTWPFRNWDSAVVIEVFLIYTPFAMTAPFWTNAPGTQTIYERVYVRPRSGAPLYLDPAS